MSRAREENRKQVEEDAEMNMTPMIDVVFLLIIFFLCIDFKILEAKLPAYLPKDVGTQSTKVEPQEKLRIKIVCDSFGKKVLRPFQSSKPKDEWREATYKLVGHQVHYMVGPERVDSLQVLKKRLEELRPSKMIKDEETGDMKPVGVVVEPDHGAVYNDVAPVVDVIYSAEFTDINFGGGMGSMQKGKYSKVLKKPSKK